MQGGDWGVVTDPGAKIEAGGRERERVGSQKGRKSGGEDDPNESGGVDAFPGDSFSKFSPSSPPDASRHSFLRIQIPATAARLSVLLVFNFYRHICSRGAYRVVNIYTACLTAYLTALGTRRPWSTLNRRGQPTGTNHQAGDKILIKFFRRGLEHCALPFLLLIDSFRSVLQI